MHLKKRLQSCSQHGASEKVTGMAVGYAAASLLAKQWSVNGCPSMASRKIPGATKLALEWGQGVSWSPAAMPICAVILVEHS